MAYITIPNETTLVSFTVGGTPQVQFPFSFALFAKADMHVSVGGVELTQADFTVVGVLLQGGGYQGGVVFVNLPVIGNQVILWRTTIPQRVTNFAPASYVAVRDLDTQFNLITAMAQDNRRDIVSAVALSLIQTNAAASAAAAAASAVQAAAAAGLPGLSSTSVTSNTIGTGGKTFTIGTGKSIPTGSLLVISDASNNANYMHGMVTGYDPVTGILAFNSLDTKGSGTIASWNVAGSGPQGTNGAGIGDLVSTNNLSDLTNMGTARTNLAVPGLATINTFPLAQTLTVGGVVTQAAGVSSREIGYAGSPRIAKGANFTTTAAGLRCTYYVNTTCTMLIDSNANVAVDLEDWYRVVVPSGVTVTLSITSDTLRRVSTNATGTRTILGPAIVTITKEGTTEWWMTDVGGTVT